MKDILLQLKPLLDKINSFRGSYRKEGIWPMRDWKIILTITFIFFFLNIAIAVYFYLEVDQGKLFMVSSKNSEGEIQINTDLFQKTISDIKDRASNQEKIKNSSAPKDPSV